MKRRPKQKLTPFQKQRLRKVCIALFCIALLWLLLAPGSGVVALLRQRSALEALEQETQRLKIQNEELQAEIEKLREDPEYLEEIARKEYGLLKKNERVYDFSKPEQKEE